MRRGHTADAAVITEPTSGRVVVANAGALTFELRVTGRAAHGSTRLEGHSALEAYLPVHAALAELERERNTDIDPLYGDLSLPYPISVGIVLGRRLGELGARPARRAGPARRPAGGAGGAGACRAGRAVAQACDRDAWLRDHPVEVTWPGGQFASGRIEPAHPLVADVVGAVAAVEGRAAALGAAPYGSDLRLYADEGGIPTLHYGRVTCASRTRRASRSTSTSCCASPGPSPSSSRAALRRAPVLSGRQASSWASTRTGSKRKSVRVWAMPRSPAKCPRVAGWTSRRRVARGRERA